MLEVQLASQVGSLLQVRPLLFARVAPCERRWRSHERSPLKVSWKAKLPELRASTGMSQGSESIWALEFQLWDLVLGGLGQWLGVWQGSIRVFRCKSVADGDPPCARRLGATQGQLRAKYG